MVLSTPASGTEVTGPRPVADPDGAGLTSALAAGAGADARSSSLWRDALRRLRRNRLAMAGGIVIGLLGLIAIFADLIAPRPYTRTNFGRLNEAPTREYPLGTDQLGRDMLSRMIYGARVSRLVGHRPADAGPGAGHQGEGVRRRRPRPRRRVRPSARPPHPAQRADADRGGHHVRYPGGDLHGGGAVVHRG